MPRGDTNTKGVMKPLSRIPVGLNSLALEWSRNHHTLREFLDIYADKLPMIISVQNGYMGKDELHTFATNEMYWIRMVKTQRRVVSREKGGYYVSIPVDYPLDVTVYAKDGKVHLASLLEVADMRSQCKDAFSIVLENDKLVNFSLGADEGSKASLGVLTVTDVYDEHYFIGYPIIHGEVLLSHSVTIPAYVTITVSVAKGIQRKSRDIFETLMANITKAIDALYNVYKINHEIILFPKNITSNDYEYIDPADILRMPSKTLTPTPTKETGRLNSYVSLPHSKNSGRKGTKAVGPAPASASLCDQLHVPRKPSTPSSATAKGHSTVQVRVQGQGHKATHSHGDVYHQSYTSNQGVRLSESNALYQANPSRQSLPRNEPNPPYQANPSHQPFPQSQLNPPYQVNPSCHPLPRSQPNPSYQANSSRHPPTRSQANLPYQANPSGEAHPLTQAVFTTPESDVVNKTLKIRTTYTENNTPVSPQTSYTDDERLISSRTRYTDNDKPISPPNRYSDKGKPIRSRTRHTDDDKPISPPNRYSDKGKPIRSRTRHTDDYTPISPQTRYTDDDKPISPQTRHTDDYTPISPQTRYTDDDKPLSPQTRHTDDDKPISPQTRYTDDDKPLSPQTRHTDDYTPISPQTRYTDDDKPISPQTRYTDDDKPISPQTRYTDDDKPISPQTRYTDDDKPISPPLSKHTSHDRAQSRIEDMTVNEITDWMHRMKMSQYTDTIVTNGVDGIMLKCLNEDILICEFGFTRFHAIKLLKFANEGYRPK